MKQIIEEIQKQINSVIIGKEEVVSRVLMAILAQGHVLLEDVPGVGKTTMAVAFAKTLGLESKRVQFTSDTMPSDIIGFSLYEKESGEFVYKPGAVMTNLLLADEINRTSSKTQSALLEAMEEFHVTVDGQTHQLPDPFVVLATQNPVGSAGTQLLPSSQMDRFLIKLSMGYPDRDSQIGILKDRHYENPLNKITPVIDINGLRNLIEETRKTYMADEIYAYIADLTEATRNHEMIELGISPRGALALSRMTKAHAFVSGRDYVVPEDVTKVFSEVCCHRFVMSSKAKLRSFTAEAVAKEILESITSPEVKSANGN